MNAELRTETAECKSFGPVSVPSPDRQTSTERGGEGVGRGSIAAASDHFPNAITLTNAITYACGARKHLFAFEQVSLMASLI
jgi:hypothetical protein